jgi:hypothetical protein
MKVTIEYEDKDEAIQALNADRWQGALWKLDQELRGIVKHGYIGNREATDFEIEVYNKCREMLRDAMNDNDITFDL